MRRIHFSAEAMAVLVVLVVLVGCASPTPEPPTAAPAPTTAPEPTEAQETVPSEPDLAGETITIYAMGDVSGPYAATTAPVVTGVQDLVADVNESGGVFGAQLEFRFEDTGGAVDQAVSIYDRYHGGDENMLMLVLFSTLDEQALWQRVKEDQVPTMGSAPDATALYSEDDGWMFAVIPLYSDQLGHFLDFLVANWDEVKPEGAGDEIKLAHLSWPGGYGQASLTDETRAHMEELGVELVANETYEISPQADTTTAILNAQAAGANVIWTNTLAFGVANLLNDLVNLGVRDQFVVGTNMLGMDLATYAFLSDPSHAVDMYAPFPFAWWGETDNPGVQLVEEMFTKYEREPNERGLGRLIGQSSFDVAVEALERAILEVGYGNLTGQAVYDALSGIEDYDVLEGLTTIDFTDGLRAGRLLQIRQIQGGPDKFVVIEESSLAPDMRPGQ